MSEYTQTIEQKRKHVLYLREQSSNAKADHQHLNQLLNRFMAGTATNEEIFLALNNAATKMLIFSQTSTNLGDIVANFYQIDEEIPTPRQQKPPTLRMIEGGKGSTKPMEKRKPRKRVEVQA